MLSSELMELGIMALGAMAVVGLALAVSWPYISGEKQTEKRIKGVTETRTAKNARRVAVEQGVQRKQAVSETLKLIEEQQRRSKRITLATRLRRAGLEISERTYWIGSLVSGILASSMLFLAVPAAPIVASIVAGFVGFFGLPRWLLGYLIRRRQKAFLNDLAGAIDVIVRGIKSGLPLNECLAIIARETPDPLRSEFSIVMEEQRVGIPLQESFQRLMVRMPLQEVRFLAIVIAIQQSAGGNLSEALGNLAGVLRSRKQLKAKVAALSAEAKASAWVLGILPIVVMALVYMTTPGYMEPLWTTTLGKFMLACSAVWMTTGILVMKKMVNFKY